MSRKIIVGLMLIVLIASAWNAVPSGAQPLAGKAPTTSFTAKSGEYTLSFKARRGTIEVTRAGRKAALAIRELGGDAASNLLASVRLVRHAGSAYTLTGKAKWATFTLTLTLYSDTPGLMHIQLSAKSTRSAPDRAGLLPDIQLVHAPATNVKVYAEAPPTAGTSLFASSTALQSSILYVANLTALGAYFDHTRSGGGQSNFSYPHAGGEGALVGSARGSFGYAPPPTSVGNLPRGKTLLIVDSYLYLVPGVPSDEAAMASSYMQSLGTVFLRLPHPSMPTPDWKSLAAKTATDLSDPSNFVQRDGLQYLRSYVSDTRTSPELITQAGILAGVRAYEARFHVTLPLDAVLEANLPSFYDPLYHTVKNGLGGDVNTREESWYFVGNLISLLQAAQAGSPAAHRLLFDSIDTAITLAHVNDYEFPQNFRFAALDGKDSGLQSDVAGSYAWLMLGMFDLTADGRYLTEAKASIGHIAGKGFGLSYELHMTAYTAAAAERLFAMTGDAKYRSYALLALANFFHATRLWDCTYGFCKKGAGYHTYMGVNILPWGDYIAMLEQYESWLGLRDYLKYAKDEPAPVRALVDAFVSDTPSMLQYMLPPVLPAGDVPTSPGLYSTVHSNNLSWNIPVEDLREGESQSGSIGQEIYGAGGPFMLAAYGP